MAIELRSTLDFTSATREQILALPTTHPGVEELNLQGCQSLGDRMIGRVFTQLKNLKVIQLTGSNFSPEKVLAWFFDEEGRGSVRIELYDAVARKGILTKALYEAEVSSRLSSPNHPTTKRDWMIVHELTKSGSWSPEEMKLLLVRYESNRHCRFQNWRDLVMKISRA